jgi:L-ascorbate metabolism protein UlaG (beta-lactamase superfamily)
MTTIRRLTHSCVIVTDDDHSTLIDPDFFTFTSGAIDLSSIGDITRVLITHEHGDHVHPEFVAWLKDRRDDLVVFSNQAVHAMLSKSDIDVSTEVPEETSVQDVLHERIPNGATPPNRAWTVGNVFTHPGDSYGLKACAPVLSLPLIAPWGSTTASVDFAKRLSPRQVIPAHDFYLSEQGRSFIPNLVAGPLREAGIELVPLGWGDSYTV